MSSLSQAWPLSLVLHLSPPSILIPCLRTSPVPVLLPVFPTSSRRADWLTYIRVQCYHIELRTSHTHLPRQSLPPRSDPSSQSSSLQSPPSSFPFFLLSLHLISPPPPFSSLPMGSHSHYHTERAGMAGYARCERLSLSQKCTPRWF